MPRLITRLEIRTYRVTNYYRRPSLFKPSLLEPTLLEFPFTLLLPPPHFLFDKTRATEWRSVQSCLDSLATVRCTVFRHAPKRETEDPITFTDAVAEPYYQPGRYRLAPQSFFS